MPSRSGSWPQVPKRRQTHRPDGRASRETTRVAPCPGDEHRHGSLTVVRGGGPTESGFRGMPVGGRVFDAASYFASLHLTRDDERRSGTEWTGEGSRPVLDGALAFGWLVLRLPRVDIRLSDDPSGVEIAAHLSVRWRGLRWRRVAQDVLRVPERAEDYFRSRTRQALRTNLHRAERKGMTCEQIGTARDLDAFVSTFNPSAAAAAELEQHVRTRPHDLCWMARDAVGQTIGVLLAVVDSEVAMLRYLVGTTSEARYLLHAEFVTFLCSRGTRYLIVAGPSPLAMTPGLQYFQRRLGYGIAHLRVRRLVNSAAVGRWSEAGSAPPTLVATSATVPTASDTQSRYGGTP
jgi:hypothetical protein